MDVLTRGLNIAYDKYQQTGDPFVPCILHDSGKETYYIAKFLQQNKVDFKVVSEEEFLPIVNEHSKNLFHLHVHYSENIN